MASLHKYTSLLIFGFVCTLCVKAEYEDYSTKDSNIVKCYQCAYTPDKTEVEEIRVPKIVQEEVSVPRFVTEKVKLPRVIWEENHRPRIITEEHTFFDDASGQWKVGTKTKQVFDLIWISREFIEEKDISRQVNDVEMRTKQVYDIRKVTHRTAGGWDKCLGPFSEKEATEWGVEQWECESSCYVKVDRNGNLLRGCYKDEFGVDPTQHTCQKRYDTMYCFCEGNLCNSGAKPKWGAQDKP